MAVGRAGEDYLEAVYILGKSKKNVHSIDLAHYVGVSKPSISYAVKELKKQNLILMNGDGSLVLTEEGEQIAKEIYERHCFFEQMLVHAGVEEEVAQKEACRLEHVISKESFQKLKKNYDEEKEELHQSQIQKEQKADAG